MKEHFTFVMKTTMVRITFVFYGLCDRLSVKKRLTIRKFTSCELSRGFIKNLLIKNQYENVSVKANLQFLYPSRLYNK